MVEKAIQKIEQLKEDNSTKKEYVKCLCESNKAKELFNSNEEFKKLEEYIKGSN